MNEVIKASLAGIGFIFDAAAYEELRAYIDKLEKSYKNNPDGKEIIEDIEARLVELILSKQPLEQVVSQDLVHEALEQLGMPEDIGETRPDGDGQTYATGDSETRKFPRRLYRDKDGAKLGGVCSGLGTFFNVDPVWFRLVIFMPLLALIVLSVFHLNILNSFLGSLFGTFILLYVILWIAIPLARTPRQVLEMRGEKITASAIHRSIQEEAEYMPQEAQRSASIFSRIFLAIGQIILFGIKLVAIIIAFAIAVTAIGGLIAVIASILYPTKIVLGDLNLLELGTMLSGFEGISVNGYVALVIAAMVIPLIMIVYQIARVIFKFKNNRTLMWILAAGWLVIVVYGGVITVRNIDSFVNFSRNTPKYKHIELLNRYVDTSTVGTVILNGDTIINNQGFYQLDEFMDKVNDINNVSINATFDEGRLYLNIKAENDSTEKIKEIQQITKDSINGDNQ